ncbi:hypothetical protein AX15_005082 [Amanita polypyramis BW_CC]|nr:hypothetical protein AX15_005082 [Amanita polypyramis BW_CC]
MPGPIRGAADRGPPVQKGRARRQQPLLLSTIHLRAMQSALVNPPNSGAGRQPFAPMQNLPTSAPWNKLRRNFIPAFTRQGEIPRASVSVCKPLSRNIDICQPRSFAPSMDNSAADMSISSIYSQDNTKSIQAEVPAVRRSRDAIKGEAAGAPSPVAAEDGTKFLKRVRTVNGIAGIAMKERRRKGQLDLPTESLEHISMLLKKRREAAERFYKF